MPFLLGEDYLPSIACLGCDKSRDIGFHVGSVGGSSLEWKDAAVLRGVHTCGYCGKKGVFEISGRNEVTFAPGTMLGSEDDLDQVVPVGARDAYREALLCYYGAAYRGTIAMCRSAVEEALDGIGVEGRDLYAKVDDAKSKGLLGDEEISLAHSARLTGRDVLHRGRAVDQGQATHALIATFDLVNHIASQTAIDRAEARERRLAELDLDTGPGAGGGSHTGITSPVQE